MYLQSSTIHAASEITIHHDHPPRAWLDTSEYSFKIEILKASLRPSERKESSEEVETVREPFKGLLHRRLGTSTMRSAALTGCLCASLLAARPTGAQDILTLPRALELAGRSSFQADTAKLAEAGAREETFQIKALYYPEVSLDGGHTNLDNDPFFKFGPTVFPAGEQVYWSYDLKVRELLWDFGRRGVGLKASRFKEQAVTLRNGDAIRRAQAEVAARYMALLTVKAEQSVVAQRRRALSDHLRIVKDLFDQGMVARNDLLRTEVALRSLDDADGSLRNAYSTALEAMNVAMGLPPGTPQVLPEEMPPPPPVPWDEARCREISASSNGSVQALEASVSGLEERMVLQKRDYYPNVVAQFDNSYQQNRYLLYPHVNSLFVGLSWNLFDGGVRASKIRQAQTDLDTVRRELLEARRQAEVAAAKALREFNQALDETKTAKANVDASVENLRIVEDQYKEGLARTTDVLDAESVLAESRSSLIQKHYQAYTKQAALLAVMGEDLAAFYGTTEPGSSTGENKT
jgi:outer membrane protein